MGRRWWFPVLVAIALAGGAYAAGRQAATPVPTAPPGGAPAGPVAAPAEVEADGRVVPARHVALSMAAPGVVAEVPVVEGAQVAEGDVLLRLQSARQAAALARAEAEVRRAQARRDALPAGAPAYEREAAEADLAAARALREEARAALADTVLRAPFAGVVAALAARPGEYVAPGQPVVRLADLTAWRVETEDLTELDVVRIREGDAVTVRFDAIPDLELPGRVTRIRPLGENRQGDIVYTAVVELARPDPRLRWNMTATVTFRGER